MQKKDRKANLYFAGILPFGVIAIAWAVIAFPVGKVNPGLIALSVVTVFLSSYLRIQIPRTKIHLTISDALIILSFLIYGGSVAILLATLEASFSSIRLRQKGGTIKTKTIILNMMIAAISVFVTAFIVSEVFGPIEAIIENTAPTILVALLLVMAGSQFLMNSVLVATAIAIRTQKSLWSVWNDYCLNVLVIYLAGSLMAGAGVIALHQINMFLFAAVIGIFALVYITYRRYLDDIKDTAAKAENAERERAEQAEQHVKELKHYVAELERSSKALSESREKFRHAAYHDALTGLPNRFYFLETIKTLLDKCREDEKQKFALLFLDLNRFKMMNDSLGHSMGDQLIKNVADRISRLMRKGDLVGRFSGDEFAIVLSERLEQNDAVAFAERIAKRLSEPFTLSGHQVFTSASIGIAFGRPDYSDAEDILRDADIAMYYAKNNQQDYVIFDQNMHTRAVTLLQLETDLRNAVERNEFELFYQPVIELNQMKLVGFEALLRWNHPQRGLILPNDFIPVAERTGLIVPITMQILRYACKQLKTWQSRSAEDRTLNISVNLSGKHFAYPSLVRDVKDIVDEAQIDPGCLKMEITESAVMENAENAINMLRQIKESGVKLSIDDFGTGYSSLSYLHRFPIDTLKVDRSFVTMMEDGSENGEIVRTVIALAKALKLSVVAEGIENVHQLHQLRVLRCEYGQGYLLSRPLPVNEIDKLLDDKLRWQNILPSHNFELILNDQDFSHLTH